MREKIIRDLTEIEKSQHIEILFACESGSRAWGFPSLDSDYDVRFIYKHKTEDYLAVFEKPLGMNFPIQDDLDFVGWDIRKVFSLLAKSNTTVFEWLQSPIVYKQNECFTAFMRAILSNYYDRKKHIHHYLGIVKGRLETMNKDEIKLKSFFYTMRSLLSAEWNAVKGCHAEMEFLPLTSLLSESLQMRCNELKAFKAESMEDCMFDLSKELKVYLDEKQDQLWAFADTLERVNLSKERANADFYKIISDDYRKITN